MKQERSVFIENKAKRQLRDAYKYILKNSVQNAEKLQAEILSSIEKLAINPEIHPLDKYRTGNDGSFRAYELYRYRITYYITEKQIIVIRIRHTSMEPQFY